jgi:hypothetical protein
MLHYAILMAGLAITASAQQTEVAGGYHIVHAEKTVATPAASTEKTPAKKMEKKKAKHLKSIMPGK